MLTLSIRQEWDPQPHENKSFTPSLNQVTLITTIFNGPRYCYKNRCSYKIHTDIGRNLCLQDSNRLYLLVIYFDANVIVVTAIKQSLIFKTIYYPYIQSKLDLLWDIPSHIYLHKISFQGRILHQTHPVVRDSISCIKDGTLFPIMSVLRSGKTVNFSWHDHFSNETTVSTYLHDHYI